MRWLKSLLTKLKNDFSDEPIIFFSGKYPKNIRTWVSLKRRVLYYNGKYYRLSEKEFWYLAPSETDFNRSAIRPPHALKFGFLLHNTRVLHGVTPLVTDLLKGKDFESIKFGYAKLAEDLIEKIRADKFPHKPSRLSSHFLNSHKHVAETRNEKWFSKRRKIENCFIIETNNHVHYADVTIYEQLINDPTNEVLAEEYWNTFIPQKEEDFYKLEILVDSNLYFPNWRKFPLLKMQTMAIYNMITNRRKLRK